MRLNKWNLDKDDGGRYGHKLDCKFKRRLAVFGPYSYWESIRVIQKNPGERVEFLYYRAVAQSERVFDMNLLRYIYKTLNFLLSKRIDIYDARGTKYIYKYPFVGDLFKEVVRNRKLEQLGI